MKREHHAQHTKGARPVGRPRATGRPSVLPAREEILRAARRLFREKGFTGTSTRDIARLAGLRQPSLFHYFPSKESILREVALEAMNPVLEFVASDRRQGHAADVALYRLIRFDTWHLCTNDNAIGSPFLLPEMNRERLPEFWKLRDRLTGHYGRLLRRGAAEGVFVVEDAGIVTRALFALGESTLEIDQASRRKRAVRLAAVTASLALRAVLREPARLDAIRARAGELSAAVAARR